MIEAVKKGAHFIALPRKRLRAQEGEGGGKGIPKRGNAAKRGEDVLLLERKKRPS